VVDAPEEVVRAALVLHAQYLRATAATDLCADVKGGERETRLGEQVSQLGPAARRRLAGLQCSRAAWLARGRDAGGGGRGGARSLAARTSRRGTVRRPPRVSSAQQSPARRPARARLSARWRRLGRRRRRGAGARASDLDPVVFPALHQDFAPLVVSLDVLRPERPEPARHSRRVSASVQARRTHSAAWAARTSRSPSPLSRRAQSARGACLL
jgi:hypothetical protein